MRLSHRLVLTCTAFLALAGCSDNSSTDNIRQNGIIYCGANQPETFNPQLVDGGMLSDTLASQMFDRLVQLNSENFKPQPMLATSWKISNDGKQYDFTLRKNVYFQKNKYFSPARALSAQDVVFSFSRLIDKNHPYHALAAKGYPWFQSLGFDKLVKKIEALNEHTVRFTLTKPDESFLAILATSYSVIHSSEYAEHLELANAKWRLDNNPIGTGAFVLNDFQANRFIRLKRHDAYWDGKPTLTQVVYDIRPYGMGDLAKLITKECDILSNMRASQIAKIKDDPNFILNSQTAMNVAYLGLNTEHPILSKVAIRQAINLAINKKTLVDSIYHGQATVATSILPPSSWAHNEQLEDQHNLQIARSLLVQNGYKHGFTVNLLVPFSQRPYNPNPMKMAELIRFDLSKAQIKVNIVAEENVQSMLWYKTVYDFDMVLSGWIADNADPDNFLRPNLSCNGIVAGLNISNWCNSHFEKSINKALTLRNPHRRLALYKKQQLHLQENMPIIPLTHSKVNKVIHSNLRGFKTTPFGDKSFARITKEQ